MANKGDFIEIVYTGRIKESGKVFDTNDADVAKKEGLKSDAKPIVVCVGEGEVVKGLDEALEGKEAGKGFSADVPAEKGFGKKDAKLYKLVPASVFKGEMHPVPGMPVQFQNGSSGVVKAVSGGRILVDFNHPLAGHDLSYDVRIIRVITDNAEKLKGLLRYYLGKDGEVEIKDGKAVIKGMSDVHELMQKAVVEKALKRMPSLKAVEFEGAKKEAEKKEDAEKKAPEEKKEEKPVEKNKAPVKQA